MVPPTRHPDPGEANTGHPRCSANAITRGREGGRGASEPTTMTPEPASGTPSSGAAGAAGRNLGPGRPGSGPGSAVKGSRKARLRWIGPGPEGPSRASLTARAAKGRHVGSWPSIGTPGAAAQRTTDANRPICSMV